MDYMTLKGAAVKWGVTPRRANYYCAGGRIPGAVKMAGVWPVSYTHLDVYKRQGLHSAGKRAGADGSEHRKHPSRL